jgi:hypothetical protein
MKAVCFMAASFPLEIVFAPALLGQTWCKCPRVGAWCHDMACVRSRSDWWRRWRFWVRVCSYASRFSAKALTALAPSQAASTPGSEPESRPPQPKGGKHERIRRSAPLCSVWGTYLASTRGESCAAHALSAHRSHRDIFSTACGLAECPLKVHAHHAWATFCRA